MCQSVKKMHLRRKDPRFHAPVRINDIVFSTQEIVVGHQKMISGLNLKEKKTNEMNQSPLSCAKMSFLDPGGRDSSYPHPISSCSRPTEREPAGLWGP